MHCPQCNSYRPGAICWKCGSETHEPCEGWEYPETPSVERIRGLARKCGYALGVHGSQERDLDLIAVPWTDDAVGNHELVEHIAKHLDARIVEIEHKPLGRVAVTLQMNGYYKPIDLSITPRG